MGVVHLSTFIEVCGKVEGEVVKEGLWVLRILHFRGGDDYYYPTGTFPDKVREDA